MTNFGQSREGHIYEQQIKGGEMDVCASLINSSSFNNAVSNIVTILISV